MKALVLGDAGLRLETSYPEPKPRRSDAIVRVLRAGICGTDLELLRGYKRFHGVPGHEFVGVVEWCDIEPEMVGKRVVGEINVGCGKCPDCRQRGARQCGRREVLGILGRDGAFAERLALPLWNLHELPDALPDDLAVLVEPTAAGYDVLRMFWAPHVTRMSAVVLGPGRLGRLVALALSSAMKRVTLVGRDDPDPENAHVIVDCTGSPDGLARALRFSKPHGIIVLKSTFADGTLPAEALSAVVVKELKINGSRCGGSDEFEKAISRLTASIGEASSLIAATYRLTEFERAFEHAARPGALKVLLDPT